MTDYEREARGQRAFNELQEVQTAFESVKSAILKALVETSTAQTEKILTLHRAAQNVDAVRKAMQLVIDDGRLASDAITQAGLTRNQF